MKLVFEKSSSGRGMKLLEACDVPGTELLGIHKRSSSPRLPQMSENEISRHYTELAKGAHGVNDGFYPLGSCTMKYNPKVNEKAASLKGFTASIPFSRSIRSRALLRFLSWQRSICARSQEWMPCPSSRQQGLMANLQGFCS